MNISITELERLAKDSMLTVHRMRGKSIKDSDYYTHFIVMNDTYVVPHFYSKFPYLVSEVLRYFQKVIQRYGLVVVMRGADLVQGGDSYMDKNFVVARVRIGRKLYWFNYYGHINGAVVIPNMPVCGAWEGIIPYRDIAAMHNLGNENTAKFFKDMSFEQYKQEYINCYGAWKPIFLVGDSSVVILKS